MSEPTIGPVPDPVPGDAPDAPAERVGWLPDVLPGFERHTLVLEPDFEGPVVATLVRRAHAVGEPLRVPDAGIDVLYVHGWTDYFFQTQLADYWERRGARFVALDLRKYGRSIRGWQTPGFVTRLRTYDEDIEAALAVIGHAPDSRTTRRLVLMGHSTGGLVLSLWAAARPGRAHGLVLNSPWLEFQTRHVGRRMLEPGVRVQAALAPLSRLINLDQGFYVRSVSSRYDGAWDIDPAWRPDAGWRATPAWLSAIFRGHERVARGLGLEVPVLVLLSTRFTPPVRWNDDMTRTDTVIDVVGVARRSADLGNHVTIVRVEGALHDVTLSAPEVRDVVWRETTRWLDAYVPPRPAAPAAPEPTLWHRVLRYLRTRARSRPFFRRRGKRRTPPQSGLTISSSSPASSTNRSPDGVKPYLR
ncbi:alpha/beta hydrolase [Isoptericola luteus]|uniref:alpha/beta hydrolase n=1 Tax=Isoptericola luteus TaxID=2879484 RepID=UPI0027E1B68D|nr:alpha/beta hydrolase [Isoptericola sp. NEAU-Y5]